MNISQMGMGSLTLWLTRKNRYVRAPLYVIRIRAEFKIHTCALCIVKKRDKLETWFFYEFLVRGAYFLNHGIGSKCLENIFV